MDSGCYTGAMPGTQSGRNALRLPGVEGVSTSYTAQEFPSVEKGLARRSGRRGQGIERSGAAEWKLDLAAEGVDGVLQRRSRRNTAARSGETIPGFSAGGW